MKISRRRRSTSSPATEGSSNSRKGYQGLEIKCWCGSTISVISLCWSVGLWPSNDSVFLALKISSGAKQDVPCGQLMLRSLQTLWNRTCWTLISEAPVRREAGTLLAVWFITQKASQMHGVGVFWASQGSGAVKLCISGSWVVGASLGGQGSDQHLIRHL